MSYSFSVRAASKAEASKKVSDELVKVLQSQPVHTEDNKQASDAAEAFIALMADDNTKDIAVSMNGSIWKSDAGIQQASVSVSVNLVAKEKG